MRTRLHFSDEHRDVVCPTCSSQTILIHSSDVFQVADDDKCREFHAGIETELEISGHWCPKCHVVTSLTINS